MDLKLALVFAYGLSCAFADPDNPYEGQYQGSCYLELNEPDCDCRVYHFFCEQNSERIHSYYEVASRFCLKNYHGLARLQSEQQHNAIVWYIKDNALDDNSCITKHGFWIGLDDRDEEGDFVWLGDTVRDGLCEPGDYSNWASGEPNNNIKKNDPGGQDCVQLWFRRGGLWDDEYCNVRPKGGVCEERYPHCHDVPGWIPACPNWAMDG
ncbi:salivary C-type lectin 2-like [Glandiceps talaboti]